MFTYQTYYLKLEQGGSQGPSGHDAETARERCR